MKKLIGKNATHCTDMRKKAKQQKDLPLFTTAAVFKGLEEKNSADFRPSTTTTSSFATATELTRWGVALREPLVCRCSSSFGM